MFEWHACTVLEIERNLAGCVRDEIVGATRKNCWLLFILK
jgi:hypothetical protein